MRQHDTRTGRLDAHKETAVNPQTGDGLTLRTEPEAPVELYDEEVVEEVETAGLHTLFMNLYDVANGGSVVPLRQMLTEIMPQDHDGAAEMAVKIRRAFLAMETLRNLATELAATR